MPYKESRHLENTMKKINTRILAAISAIASSVASAQTPAPQNELVTVENYNRAQTDVNFAGVVKNGGLGKFRHGRELAPPAQQGIVRPNRDTLYSFAIVDLDAGPVTITLPDVFLVRKIDKETDDDNGIARADHLSSQGMSARAVIG